MVAAFLQSVIPAMADEFHAMVKDFPHYLASQQHRSAGAPVSPGLVHTAILGIAAFVLFAICGAVLLAPTGRWQ